MKVLVTGGAGYIASHIVADLLDAAHEVMIIDDFSTGNEKNIQKGVALIRANISSDEAIKSMVSFHPDAVFHFAAFKAAGESMHEPNKYSSNNIRGTLQLIESMVAANINNLIFSSSAAVYGPPEYLPVDEKHRQSPINYYGYTKLVVENNLQWFSQLKGLRFAALRYFNAAGYDLKGRVTGLENSPQNLLPIVMEVAVGQREYLEVYGDDYETVDGSCVRDYIHINDLTDAHLLAMDYLIREKKDLIVNLGSESGLSVFEILESARKVTGKPIPHRLAPRREGDPAKLIASSKLAYDLLGWKARHSDADTLLESMWKVYKNQ